MHDEYPEPDADDIDVAAVLALYLTSPFDYADDPTGDAFRALVAANPALEGLGPAELVTLLWLRRVSLRLGELQLRASEQAQEMVARYGIGEGETFEEVEPRMSRADQHRMTMLGYALGMGSPLQLGPPESLLGQLALVIEMPGT